MKRVVVHIADRIEPHVYIEPVTIDVSKKLPEVPFADDWELIARARYRDDAKRIVEGLVASLPGATVDALLVELLDRKASLLRVRAP